MAFLPSQLAFPEPGRYLRFFSAQNREIAYLRLMEREFPLLYPRRLGSVAPGGRTSLMVLSELNPGEDKSHRFMAYGGVRPGAFYYLFHPYDSQRLQWDERVTQIDRESTGRITYEESPYDVPTVSIWIDHDRYPGIDAINTMNRSSIPEILIVAAKYRVLEQKDILPETLELLKKGIISSLPVSFGGEV